MIRGNSPDECHRTLIEAVNQACGVRILQSSAAGADFFGLSHPSVLHLLQGFPQARLLSKYRFVEFKVMGVKTRFFFLSFSFFYIYCFFWNNFHLQFRDDSESPSRMQHAGHPTVSFEALKRMRAFQQGNFCVGFLCGLLSFVCMWLENVMSQSINKLYMNVATLNISQILSHITK